MDYSQLQVFHRDLQLVSIHRVVMFVYSYINHLVK